MKVLKTTINSKLTLIFTKKYIRKYKNILKNLRQRFNSKYHWKRQKDFCLSKGDNFSRLSLN